MLQIIRILESSAQMVPNPLPGSAWCSELIPVFGNGSLLTECGQGLDLWAEVCALQGIWGPSLVQEEGYLGVSSPFPATFQLGLPSEESKNS